MSAVELGTGRLSWPRAERVGDRYGVVMLMVDGDSLSEPTGYIRPANPPIGQRGRLVAEVLETRESTHIGDLFRGLFPETPEVGERIVLGNGTFFTEDTDWGALTMGLEPHEPRHSDWLDPVALYRAHEQTVRLTFEPEDRPARVEDAQPGEADSVAVASAAGAPPAHGAPAQDPDAELYAPPFAYRAERRCEP